MILKTRALIIVGSGYRSVTYGSVGYGCVGYPWVGYGSVGKGSLTFSAVPWYSHMVRMTEMSDMYRYR